MSEAVAKPVDAPGELGVHPTTGRPAGRMQAFILLLSSCLAVLGSVLLAPVLPRIEDAFADTAGVEADELTVHTPDLDDVFFALTSRPTEVVR